MPELDPEIDQELLIDLVIGPIWTRLLITYDPLPPSIVDDIVSAVLRAYPAPHQALHGLNGGDPAIGPRRSSGQPRHAGGPQ